MRLQRDEQIHKAGTSWKRDREYIQGAEMAKSAPKREDCKAFIMKTLHEAGWSMPTADLDSKAKSAGYSFSSVKRAKAELKNEKKIDYFSTGKYKDKVWHIQALAADPGSDFVEFPEGTPTPLDDWFLD